MRQAEALRQEPPSERPSVLVVDDEQENLDLMVRALRPKYEVVCARDGEEALSILSNRDVDVLVTDHRMPGMSGVELLREADRRHRTPARLLVTAYGDADTLAEAINDGHVSYFVRKPWDPERIREVIARLVELRRAEREPRDRLRAIEEGAAVVPGKDPLTGLLSLPVFQERLREMLLAAGTESVPVGLICADLDDLRQMNEAEGLPAGDEAIRCLSTEIGKALHGHPDAVISRYSGGRVIAAIPKFGQTDSLIAADRIRIAYANAQGGKHSVSLGVVSFPRHGSDATHLVTLSEDAVQRAKRLGRNQVAECLPVLLVVGGLPVLRQASHGLLSRLDLTLRYYDEPAVLVEAIHRERPAVLVMNLLGSRQALDEVAALHRLPDHARMQIVLVTNKGPDAKYEARASRIPGSALVMGPVRLLPRMIEAVATALGIKQRRHLRAGAQIPVVVTRLRNRGETGFAMTGSLINLSESGAKIALQHPLAPGDAVALAFGLGDHDVKVRGRTIRVQRSPDGTLEVGIEFEDLRSEDVDVIAAFVREERPAEKRPLEFFERPGSEEDGAVRLFERQHLGKATRLKVRLKPVGTKATSYLRVADLSEGGLLAVCDRFTPPFQAGTHLEAFIFGGGISLHCTCDVVHKERANSDDQSWHLGVRFLHLNRAARGELAKALFKWKQ